MAINKVVYAGSTLIDVSGDTATPSDVLAGKTFHKNDGTQASGSLSITSEAKTCTPSNAQQVIEPTNADYLSKVTVYAIPYTETPNTYGTTVEIG